MANKQLTNQRIAHFVEGLTYYTKLYPGSDNGNPFPPTDILAAFVELQVRRKADDPELKTAELINKFYERYPLNTFKSDAQRSEALGYFMSGVELQCFGEFFKYQNLCRDE
ncbi:hypothetical protein [Kluyvera sp. Awk 3]|uniref:hypothetical protein n=1 Tax=Kluyvera sp. Awk 3 TaxID=2963956 RepID=UPI0023020084|nr:hypothetical protein [Kluyvera sp. Awk 3]MDA8489044.1 hypothetical protein [Kluyvera sp. Awk 3]